MGSTTETFVEDANTYFEDFLASTESNAKMANASRRPRHVDVRPRPIVERSVSADDVDFIMMRGTRQPATAQERYEAGASLTAAAPFRRKGPPRSSLHLSHDAEEDLTDG